MKKAFLVVAIVVPSWSGIAWGEIQELLAGQAALYLRQSVSTRGQSNGSESPDAQVQERVLKDLGLGLLDLKALAGVAKSTSATVMSYGIFDAARMARLLRERIAPKKQVSPLMRTKLCLPISSQAEARKAFKKALETSASTWVSLPRRKAESKRWQKIIAQHPAASNMRWLRRVGSQFLIMGKNGSVLATVAISKDYLQLDIMLGNVQTVPAAYERPSRRLLARLKGVGFWKAKHAWLADRGTNLRLAAGTGIYHAHALLAGVSAKSANPIWAAGVNEVNAFYRLEKQAQPVVFDMDFAFDGKKGWGLTKKGTQIFSRVIKPLGTPMARAHRLLVNYFSKGGLSAWDKDQFESEMLRMGRFGRKLLGRYYWPNYLGWLKKRDPAKLKEFVRSQTGRLRLDRKRRLLFIEQ